MRSDLTSNRAAEPAKKAAKKRKSPKKSASRTAPKRSSEKKPDSQKPARPSPFPNLPPAFNPYVVEASVDVVKKASLRFRTLFPNKWNAIKAAMTPVDVMLLAMQHQLHSGHYKEAARIAKDVAPFVHPRLSHIHATGEKSKADELTDEGLQMLLNAVEERLKDRGAIDGAVVKDKGRARSAEGQETAGTVTLLTVS